mgnify:CR=1 FL=1
MILDQIETKFIAARKEKQANIVLAAQNVKAAITTASKDLKNGHLQGDDLVLSVLGSVKKTALKTINEYPGTEIAVLAQDEVWFVDQFLPAAIGYDQLKDLIQTIIGQIKDLGGVPAMGDVIKSTKEAIKTLNLTVDGGTLAQIVKSLI